MFNMKRMLGGAIAGTMFVIASTSAMAQHYHHGGYYNPGYGGYHHDHGGFVRGAIVGGVVTSLIYQANQNRTVYVNQPSTVYYGTPDPRRLAPVYVQTYDPMCGCSVLVKQYQDQYGNYYRYP